METKDPIEGEVEQPAEDVAELSNVSDQVADEPATAEASSDKRPDEPSRKRWMRHPRNKVFGGVCGGMAAYLSVSEGIIRLLWLAIIAFSFGIGLPLYLLFWLFLPVGTAQEGIIAPATMSLKAKHGVWAAWGLIATGVLLLATNLGFFDLLGYLGSVVVGPIILICIGFYALKKFRARGNSDTLRDQVSELGSARKRMGATLRSVSGLTRSREDRMLFGVCGGVGKSLGVDPVLIRIGFVILGFCTAFVGMGFIYLVLAILIPVENEAEISEAESNGSSTSATSLNVA